MTRVVPEQMRSLTRLLGTDHVADGSPVRATLLLHGIRAFHKFGVEGTSIGRILQASGKSKSQFYSHFDSRVDFICRILELQMSTMLSVCAKEKLDTVKDFSGWFEPYLELAELPGYLGCPTGPLASDLCPSMPEVQEEASRQFRRWEEFVGECFATLALRNSFSPDFDAGKESKRFCCAVQGAFLMGRVHQCSEYVRLVGEQFQLSLSQQVSI